MSSTPVRSPIQSARHQHRDLKKDTRLFKKWLEKTAKFYGWKKIGNQKERTTRDIEAQIELVSSSRYEATFMPQDVYDALCHAIEGRKVCKEFFCEAKFYEERSTKSHQHFINILERALDVIPRRECRNHQSHNGGESQNSTMQDSNGSSSPVDDSGEWQLVRRKRR